MTTLRLGISSCLLGEEVRWDAGHKKDAFLTGTLGPFVEWVPVCPELEMGLGVPREPIRLQGDPASPRLVGSRSGEDHTDAMQRFAQRRARDLASLDLCGYVLKKSSPSCGMERVKVYDRPDAPGTRKGVGAFARVLMETMPHLPVEEEGRLEDAGLRENFITRVFAFRRWRDLLEGEWSLGRLVAFHSDQKLLLMAHSPAHYTSMGRLVAGAKGKKPTALKREYEEAYMEALRHAATPRKNTNVLFHAMGYFKKRLTPDEKQEMIEAIESYHRRLVPLIVPLTLLRHYVRRYEEPWLVRQVWLNPHPAELMLRNHV